MNMRIWKEREKKELNRKNALDKIEKCSIKNAMKWHFIQTEYL